jgi:hypothetical protein
VSLIDSQPGVQAVDAKIADLKSRRAEFETNAMKLAELDEQAKAAYDKALSAALHEGAAAPEPPVLRLNGEDIAARHQFMFEEQQLTDERRKAVAAAYPDVLKEASKQVAKLAKAARPTVEKLADEVGHVAELLGQVRVCRDAGNIDQRTYQDVRLTFDQFIKLAATGGDPISTLDLTGGRKEPERRDPGMVLGDVQQLLEGQGNRG